LLAKLRSSMKSHGIAPDYPSNLILSDTLTGICGSF
jgi:hypothetical protein